MISKEQFQELEYKYGCGYWNVCWEHACPCAITTEDKGYSEEIYNSLLAESNRVAEMFKYEDEEDSIPWDLFADDEEDNYLDDGEDIE
ncbi:MAG: hypothetical protein GX935_02020 [Erysipelotrichia bacterium]|nr:hypothetical protein [Erysipelotrichia bacterium]